MKMPAIRHPKMNRLMRLARMTRAEAVGTMEMLWHWVGDYAIDGDITDVADDIEPAVEWSGEEGTLIKLLVESGFVDEIDGRFIVHDWRDHCPEYVKKRLTRSKTKDGGQRRTMADNGRQRQTLADKSVSAEPKRRASQAQTSPDMASRDKPSPAPESDSYSGDPNEVSPAEAYSVEHDDVQAVQRSIPAARMRKPMVVVNAIRRAIVVVKREGRDPPWLAERIAAYYASPEGKSRYFSEPANWLDQGRWREDESAWSSREEQKPENALQRALAKEEANAG